MLKNGVLSKSFFNSVAENFDKYFLFGPTTPFRQSDADDSFSALDLDELRYMFKLSRGLVTARLRELEQLILLD